MANHEQLLTLKQGVAAWNRWRAKNLYVYADLNEADLNGVRLSGVDLRLAHLRRAVLFRADLRGANLSGADLSDADLREANLGDANLTNANLNGAKLAGSFARGAHLHQASLLAASLKEASFDHADLTEANLTVANLNKADLSGTRLNRANLSKADLAGAQMQGADLTRAVLTGSHLSGSSLLETRFVETTLQGTDFSEALAGNTLWVSLDLSKCAGLESMDHRGPSHISLDTLVLSAGKIPAVFLRGCGLSDTDIEYARLSDSDLAPQAVDSIVERLRTARAAQGRQDSPVFISASTADHPFVERMGSHLTQIGIRYWHDLNDGRHRPAATQPASRSGSRSPKVVLVLSEQSIASDWIGQKLQEIRELEREKGESVLYPVALDESLKDGRPPNHIREQIMGYSVFDFSGWRDPRKFDASCQMLLEALHLTRAA